MKSFNYKEINQTHISENEIIVLSECSEGGYALSKKILADVNGKKVGMFLKGGIKISDLEGLKNIYKALGNAIETLENKEF